MPRKKRMCGYHPYYVSLGDSYVEIGISKIYRALVKRRGYQYFKAQVDENPEYIDYQCFNGNTALHTVFDYHDGYKYEYFELLLERGADVNLLNMDEDSPFSLLCEDLTYELMIPLLKMMLKNANKDSINAGICEVVKNFFNDSGCSQRNIETDCKLRHSNAIEAIDILLNKGAKCDVQYLKEIIEKLGEMNLNGDCLKKFKSVCKLLIQNAFIKNEFEQSYIENTLSMINVTSSDNDKLVVLLELCNFITNYVNVCKNEVGFLKNTYLSLNYSIYDFMQQYFQASNSTIDCSANIAKMLFSFQQSRRVHFRKIFYRCVKNLNKESLLKVEANLRRSQEGKVAENILEGLNKDCFLEIVKYLSKDELITLMTGMYGVFT